MSQQYKPWIDNIVKATMDVDTDVRERLVKPSKIPIVVLQYTTILEAHSIIIPVLDGVLEKGWVYKSEWTGVAILRTAAPYRKHLKNYRKFYFDFRFELHKRFSNEVVNRKLIGLEPKYECNNV